MFVIANNIGKTMPFKRIKRSCTLDVELLIFNVENVVVGVEDLIFVVVVLGVDQFISQFDHGIVEINVSINYFKNT
jgi:hypothetical protein